MRTIITLFWFALACFTLGFGATRSDAVPDRAPSVKYEEPEQLKAIALNDIPKEGFAVFGGWLVCSNIDEHGVIVIHRQTRLAIYLPWASNGWINYRTADGTSYVLWTHGTSDPQNRNYYFEKFIDKPPQARLAPGTHKFNQWTVTVTASAMEFHCAALNCRMTIRANESTFTHNKRTVSAVK